MILFCQNMWQLDGIGLRKSCSHTRIILNQVSKLYHDYFILRFILLISGCMVSWMYFCGINFWKSPFSWEAIGRSNGSHLECSWKPFGVLYSEAKKQNGKNLLSLLAPYCTLKHPFILEVLSRIYFYSRYFLVAELFEKYSEKGKSSFRNIIS